MHCGRFIGMVHDKKYFLHQSEIIVREKKITIVGVGCNEKDNKEIMKRIETVATKEEYFVLTPEFKVKKSDLEKIKITSFGEFDGLVIIHKIAGRVLLSDQNGIYRNIYQQMMEKKSMMDVANRQMDWC